MASLTADDENIRPRHMASGTQSPPLEATGEHEPMGISSVNNPDAKIEVVPDSEQRARMFSSSAVSEAIH